MGNFVQVLGPFYQPNGVLFPRPADLAMLREEWEGRLEATSREGEVAWSPGPLPPVAPPPLHRVAPGVLVNPLHVQRSGEVLHLPGGWTLPASPLPAVEAPPSPDPDEPRAMVYREPRWVWLTPSGERPGPRDRREALALYPDLVAAGRWMVRPGAVRRLQRLERGRGRVVLDSGHELVATWNSLDGLARALGLAHPDLLDGLPPRHRVAYERGLRDWPTELMAMDPAELRRIVAGDGLRLLDLAIWQIYRVRSQGRELPYGHNPRALHYNPMVLLAARAGLLEEAEGLEAPVPSSLLRLWSASLPEVPRLRRKPSKKTAGWTRDRLWTSLQDRLELFVGAWRYFTYRGLGCRDQGERDRRLGVTRPTVILLVEKDSLEPEARIVAEMFDVTMLVMGGAPTYIALEFLVEALGGPPGSPVILVSFCDFDPYGWHFPVAASAQLARYGVATGAIHRLVRPERFTPQELEIVALPLPAGSAGTPELERFMKETGGVGGRALGIYGDYLKPVLRVAAAFAEETGLEPVMTLEEAMRRAGS